MNKYHSLLQKIATNGRRQVSKKGSNTFLVNQSLKLEPSDLLDLFESHPVAKRKLKDELQLFMSGETNVEAYREIGVTWWDYCGQTLVNSYPSYLEHLPDLVSRIKQEKRTSKNYVLFLGANGVESNQHPCLSLIQFQIVNNKLLLSAYQRSSDANLGLPADIYHLYLISRLVDIPLKSITLFLANVHIYDNNLSLTHKLLSGDNVKFNLNV
jgi:thymidylate synthase